MKKKYSVFLSYAHQDAALARRIAKQIERTGALVILETNISLGASFEKEVRKAMSASDEVVLVVTPNSGSSPQLSFEGGLAAGLGKPVVPLLNNVKPSDVPLALSSFKVVKSDDLDWYLAGLSEKLRKL